MQLNPERHVNMRVGYAEVRTFKKRTLWRKKRLSRQHDESPEERINVYGIFPFDVKPTFKRD